MDNSTISRRWFLGSAAASLAPVLLADGSGAESANSAENAKSKPPKVVVGAHPWVYAASQPQYDITPILPAIFADMEYAGMGGIELMHTALRPPDSVDRIGELSLKSHLPVIGSSFGGDMWDRSKHAAVLEDAELVVSRLARLGGRTLGTSVGQAPKKKTEGQLDDQAELLRKSMAFSKKHGLVLNLHNHTYEVADGLHDLKGTLALSARSSAGDAAEAAIGLLRPPCPSAFFSGRQCSDDGGSSDDGWSDRSGRGHFVSLWFVSFWETNSD